jgi:hypothetical protein
VSASLRAFFAEAEQAEAALAFVAPRAALTGSAIVERGSVDALGRMGLPGEAVAEAAAELEGGGVLLVLVVAERAELADVRAALDAHRGAERDEVCRGEDGNAAPPAEGVGRGLLVGAPLVVPSHARVEMFAEIEAAPEAEASGEAPFSADAAAAAGLFAGRSLEFAEMREEAVVSRRTAVREELVIRKSVKERVERVSGSVRHTEIAVEELTPAGARHGSAFVARGAEPYEPPA